jgi:hypothetical protein
LNPCIVTGQLLLKDFEDPGQLSKIIAPSDVGNPWCRGGKRDNFHEFFRVIYWWLGLAAVLVDLGDIFQFLVNHLIELEILGKFLLVFLCNYVFHHLLLIMKSAYFAMIHSRLQVINLSKEFHNFLIILQKSSYRVP